MHPKVHFVFWGDWDAAGYTDRWTRLLQGPVLDRLAEYGNKGATLEGPFYQQTTNVPVDTIPGSVNEDATIPATLEDYFHKGTIPAPSGEDVYVVFLPPGTTTKLFQLEGAVGAHTASVYNGTWYTYAIIRDVHADLTLSHELYESITDPYGTGWHNGPQQEEIGDMCDPFRSCHRYRYFRRHDRPEALVGEGGGLPLDERGGQTRGAAKSGRTHVGGHEAKRTGGNFLVE